MAILSATLARVPQLIRVAAIALLLGGLASGCAHVGSRCVRAEDCGGELTCNGNFPTYQACRTDSDCHTTDGTRAECGSVMMNGELRDHTCVHPGTCVSRRETLP